MTTAAKPYYEVGEVARMFGYDPETIRKKIRAGEIEAYKLPGCRRYAIPARVIDRAKVITDQVKEVVLSGDKRASEVSESPKTTIKRVVKPKKGAKGNAINESKTIQKDKAETKAEQPRCPLRDEFDEYLDI